MDVYINYSYKSHDAPVEINKNRLIKSFSKSANTYNQWAIPQYQVAEHLINCLDKNTFSGKILDAGCGTGIITNHIKHLFPEANITGIDISPKMIDNYNSIYGQGILNDMQNLSFQDNYFDHCISSFSLHWTDFKKSLSEIIRVSNKFISFALPIEGSFISNNFPFPKKEDIILSCINYGLSIQFKTIQKINIPYQGLDLLKYFHYTGTSLPYLIEKKGIASRKTILKWLDSIQNPNYQILFLHGTKDPS